MKNIAACKLIGLGLLLSAGFTIHPVKLRPMVNELPHAYSFIKYDQNRLITANPDAMRHFYLSLDSLLNGYRKKINIVHLGDSHVQADVFPGKIREHFQLDTLIGNGGRGFVFPYSAVRTNNPVNLRVSYTGLWEGCRNVQRDRFCDWGLAGITATTADPGATFTLNPNTNPALTYPISTVKVFYNTQNSASFGVRLITDGDNIVSRRTDARGFVEFVLKSPLDKVMIGLEKTDISQTNFTLQGVAVENDFTGVQYHSLGVNGAEVTSFLRNPHLEQNLAVLKADLIVLSLGTNDAYMLYFDEQGFKRNYGTLLQRIKKAAPQASILFTTPGDCYRSRRYTNYNNAKAVKQIRQLAEETDCAVWNFYDVMGGLRSINKWHLSGLAAKDRIHLNGKGYQLQGDLLYEAMMNDFGTYSAQHSKLTKQ